MMRRGYNLDLLKNVIEQLLTNEELPRVYKDHILNDDKKYKKTRECHITPDWLLIYRIEGDTLLILRTGSHSDLF